MRFKIVKTGVWWCYQRHVSWVNYLSGVYTYAVSDHETTMQIAAELQQARQKMQIAEGKNTSRSYKVAVNIRDVTQYPI